MNEEYKKELADLKYKMLKAEKFAEKLPLFSEQILERKLSGSEQRIKFDSRYKGVYFAWGINRGFFGNDLDRSITNYSGDDYKEYLFSIYINTLSMYDSHEDFGLFDVAKSTNIFAVDYLNSTFYAKDSQIEGLLDALVVWHENAVSKIGEFNKQKEIKELEGRLAKLATIEGE